MITGPMYGGKSEELIRLLSRAEIAQRPTACFRPAQDTWTERGYIVSRNGSRFPTRTVDDVWDILALSRAAAAGRPLVGIEEVQLFTTDGIVRVAEALVADGFDVVCSGLDMDHAGRPFNFSPHLLAVADEVRKLDAICVVCGETATRSQIRVPVPDDPPPGFYINNGKNYEARCRTCHIPFPTEPL
jgi:thymidine kinase